MYVAHERGAEAYRLMNVLLPQITPPQSRICKNVNFLTKFLGFYDFSPHFPSLHPPKLDVNREPSPRRFEWYQLYLRRTK